MSISPAAVMQPARAELLTAPWRNFVSQQQQPVDPINQPTGHWPCHKAWLDFRTIRTCLQTPCIMSYGAFIGEYMQVFSCCMLGAKPTFYNSTTAGKCLSLMNVACVQTPRALGSLSVTLLSSTRGKQSRLGPQAVLACKRSSSAQGD